MFCSALRAIVSLPARGDVGGNPPLGTQSLRMSRNATAAAVTARPGECARSLRFPLAVADKLRACGKIEKDFISWWAYFTGMRGIGPATIGPRLGYCS